jgi:hypothetical protein
MSVSDYRRIQFRFSACNVLISAPPGGGLLNTGLIPLHRTTQPLLQQQHQLPYLGARVNATLTMSAVDRAALGS